MSQFPFWWDGYFVFQVKIIKLLDFASFFFVEISFSIYPVLTNIFLSLISMVEIDSSDLDRCDLELFRYNSG